MDLLNLEIVFLDYTRIKWRNKIDCQNNFVSFDEVYLELLKAEISRVPMINKSKLRNIYIEIIDSY